MMSITALLFINVKYVDLYVIDSPFKAIILRNKEIVWKRIVI